VGSLDTYVSLTKEPCTNRALLQSRPKYRVFVCVWVGGWVGASKDRKNKAGQLDSSTPYGVLKIILLFCKRAI